MARALVAARNGPGWQGDADADGVSQAGPDPVPAGWAGALRLELARIGSRTALARAAHRGPLRVQRALYPEGGAVCHVYVLHPPGGVVDTDSLELSIDAGPGAWALVTTPGASRLYRSRGPSSSLATRIAVEAGGAVEHLPQETIAFSGCRARTHLEVDLAAGARFLGWEITALGRPAAGELFAAGFLDQRIVVRRAGRPLYVERSLHRAGDERLSARFGLGGCTAIGTLVAVGPDRWMEGELARVRRAVAARARPGLAAATRLDDSVVVCRYLGDDARDALACLEEGRRALRPLLLGRAAVAPRIWAT